MKVRSVRVNFILNVFRVVSGALIGILTMPYINKILGAESVGKVEYVNTIINYFLLFSALGIPMYGIREIAKIRENVYERSKATLELLLILGITTILSYALIFGVLYQLAFFENYQDLILLMSTMVLLSNIGAEWYFQGMEDQLYITIRYVIVRLLTLILLFTMVNDSSDYLSYALFIVLTVSGSNFLNLFYLFRSLNFTGITFKTLDLKKHLRPIMTIFAATVSINIYLHLDNFLIGSIAGDIYVGYYSVANKMVRVVISFIIVIGTVLLPRLSKLYIEDKINYYASLKKVFNLIMLMAFPFTVLFLVYSKNIIALMAGDEFIPSILTLRILSPLCIVVGLAYFIGHLFLYTQNKEKLYTKAVFFSAIFSILLNFYAIKTFNQNGAAVVATLSELLAVLMMFYFAKREMQSLKIFNTNFVKIIAASVIMLLFSYLCITYIDLSNLLLFFFALCLSFGCFLLSLLFLKENVSTDLLNKSWKYIVNLNNTE